MKTKEEISAIKEEVEAMKGKLAELSDDEMRFVVGGSHEIAETLIDGLMSDKTHPGFVM